MLRTMAMLTVLLLTIAACGEEGPGGEPIDDGEWRLSAGTVDSSDLVLIDHRPVTLLIDGETAGGTAACNLYGAGLAGDGDRVSFVDLHYTAMACLEEGVMDLEAGYLAALARVETAAETEDELLLTGEGVMLRFEPLPPEPDEALVGTQWVLETLLDGDVAETAAADASIRFDDDGTVTGHNGCNGFGGTYDPDTGFSDLIQTEIGCEGTVAAQEARFMGVLGAAPTLTVTGPELTIAAPDGQALVFRAAS